MSLRRIFDEQYRILRADTPALRSEAFKIRYKVICEELRAPGYEPHLYPNCEETDSYDYRAAHCLLQHKDSGTFLGSVRLVLADPTDPEMCFPIETASGILFDLMKVEPKSLPRRHTAEISRLVITRSPPDDSILRALQGPLPVLGLFAAVVRLAVEFQVTHLFGIMEPVLNRLLRRFGLHFDPIGPIVDYHGRRQPHLSRITDINARLHRDRYDVWELMTDGGVFAPPLGEPALSEDTTPAVQPILAVSS